jgi:hypothetical protein
MKALLTRCFEILNNWGKPVFGLVFWGSVGGALLHTIFPELSLTTTRTISGLLGLAAGLRAKKVQGWI